PYKFRMINFFRIHFVYICFFKKCLKMNCLLNIRNLYTESIKTYIKCIQNVSFPYTYFL
ncbi:hypothetical protein GLOIN_2v1579896, partial [Rhizophagus irregularis DAOM 181602=DAOM 197198]